MTPATWTVAPNTVLNTPTITNASTASVSGTAYAGATVEVYQASRPAGQFGLPIAYLGSAVANSGGNWTVPVSLQATNVVTALQILPDGTTSELAANIALHVNTPPVVDTVTIAPASPTTGQTMTATVTSHDVDNDPLTTAYQWTKNGTDIPGATGATLNLATAGNGDKGDLIRVRATANDGQATSAPVTSSPETVANSAPSATVGLAPSNPSTTATVTATATKADPDADTVTLTYVWKVNGTTRKTTSNSASLTDTLDLSVAGNGDPGDVVSVEVTPNDGTVSGTLASAQVTVVAGPTVYANDAFSRTAASSWGSAPTGGAYTLSGNAADFAVNGSAGTMSVAAGANRAAFLTGVAAQDVDLTFSNATNKDALGASQYVYGVVRRVSTTNEYRAKLRYATNGTVFIQATAVVNNAETGIGSEVLVSGLTHTANSVIRVRVQFQERAPRRSACGPGPTARLSPLPGSTRELTRRRASRHPVPSGSGSTCPGPSATARSSSASTTCRPRASRRKSRQSATSIAFLRSSRPVVCVVTPVAGPDALGVSARCGHLAGSQQLVPHRRSPSRRGLRG